MGCSTGTYNAYGGFNYTVDIFTQVASVFGNEKFNLIADAILACTIIFSIVKGLVSSLFHRDSSLWKWVGPIILCVVIHLAFLVSKGTLTVYDPVTHKSAAVLEVPDGIVWTASAFSAVLANFMERDAAEKTFSGSSPVTLEQ